MLDDGGQDREMTLRDLWRKFPFVTRLLTAIGLGTGAIVGVSQAWPLIDPYMLAHRAYVNERVGAVQTTTTELLQWKNEDSRNRIKADIGNWNVQLQKETDATTRTLIQRQIEQLSTELAQVDERIRKLRGP